jgi:hypothetical protein
MLLDIIWPDGMGVVLLSISLGERYTKAYSLLFLLDFLFTLAYSIGTQSIGKPLNAGR